MSSDILNNMISSSDYSNNEESDFDDLNGSNFRLDDKPSQVDEELSTKPKHLFVDEESSFIEEYDRSEVDMTEDKDYTAKDIETQPRNCKKIQSNHDKDIETEKINNYWDFKRIVQKEFKERLPENYDIKNWKRPTKQLLNNLVELMENNVETSITQVMDQYKSEFIAIHGQNELGLEKFIESKEILLFDIINKIKYKLKKIKIPSRVSDQDLNIEYIFSKRNFIKDRYLVDLQSAEKLEHQLIQEQQKHEKLKQIFERENESYTINTKQLMNNLITDIHPALSRAISNKYGLIKDTQNTKETFEIDRNELNLKFASSFLHDSNNPNEISEANKVDY